MDEQEFIQLADQELTRLEAALEGASERGTADFDVETKPGGVLEIACENGSKIIINRHTAAREIWLAAKSGGYHFRPQNGCWLATRDGEALWVAVARVLSEQTGGKIDF
ncbi:frataxin [Rugosibacter aromaticivorans]|uniref:Iron-sulfur cluster assembly protein CyaY n=1 Tax=Rugosibacter aromaticivorans TaxID=1565605 RepID=A0A0C5J1X4_9PROT|nr:iron donor protein CyaY [Rugosibacter aromaticivorans]AJP49072.1 frataxin [Rugosibacter aromaticivorans]TBR15774.1 MAG: iron donor protein CyaY [Rugosibacter sp.]